ncbi:MAG: hypothetical protein M1491_04930 [Deltaproteobacteria bacterium]|nr:hypothetical protein [Deltaproteobacteria bacterium]
MKSLLKIALMIGLIVVIGAGVSMGAGRAKKKKEENASLKERVKLSGFLVRGRLPKPQAMYIIHKSSAQIYETTPLDEDSKDFSRKIFKTMEDKTFKKEEEKWADH